MTNYRRLLNSNYANFGFAQTAGNYLGRIGRNRVLGSGITDVGLQRSAKLGLGVKKNFANPQFKSLEALRASRMPGAQGRPGGFKPPTVVGQVGRKKRFGIF